MEMTNISIKWTDKYIFNTWSYKEILHIKTGIIITCYTTYVSQIIIPSEEARHEK